MAQNALVRFLKKCRPYTILKGLRYLRHYGVKEFFVRLQERIEPEEVPYGPWYEQHRATEETLEKQRRKKWNSPALISLAVPAYRTPERFLREMLDSLAAQTYPYWELCVANASPGDEKMTAVLAEYAGRKELAGKIRVRNLEENLGISENTNAAFAMASGAYVGLLDHDDLLAPDALYEVALRIQEGADLIYTDEDKVTADCQEHYQPHFKPDFNLDLLRSNNYICHFLVVKKQLIEKAGGFRRNSTGRRITISFSVAASRRKRSPMCRGCCTTGGPIRLLRRTIPPASSTPMKRACAPWRSIWPGPERKERSARRRITGFTTSVILCRESPWSPLLFPTKIRRKLWRSACDPSGKSPHIGILRF